MPGTLIQALSYTMLAVVAALVGGLVAVYRPPGQYMESNVQHFAAGVVFAAVAAEPLPDVHTRAPSVVVVGFAAGVATMLGIHRLSKYVEKRGIGGKIAEASSLLITVTSTCSSTASSSASRSSRRPPRESSSSWRSPSRCCSSA